MNSWRRKRILKDTVRKSLPIWVTFLLLSIINFLIFALYQLPIEPFVYGTVVETSLEILVFVIFLWKNSKDTKKREDLISSMMVGTSLPEPQSLSDEDYQEMIRILDNKLHEEISKNLNNKTNMETYIASWVHQIKTPIATLRLYLDDFASDNSQIYDTELFKIEQYVDMVLQYQRITSDVNDLVITEVNIEEAAREVVRKYAGQFILKKIKLSFDVTGESKIITDKKWYSCIIEQILSNAIKYTKVGGEIKISVCGGILSVEDNGIGIKNEDIPLIFEKGYTGINGRSGEKSSGIGLFLAKMAADKLKISIKVFSSIGKGSKFVVQLKDK